ncbi:CRISPR system precrRNA processing endoribonuclease RAMP protein Cas6 [Nocardiopsis dassonvillei]|uniref:CRISPR system precrRNA processing endoribonuclease RAMP protein Cas6 n=1 Tax=Nocardiopsis dassonvillei TaxID=2014 RepID=UPI00200EE9A7|nr:CRISPR system precrRNA processing endoribonuclease RAMP protein Cas6 [Nocardiopsis dassonvillei]MCK9874104.1 CRISPR system precrRNA processing endoribonuclease RAMP protein Cas6 [Nocardiopsis dassonvillei]
METPTTDHTAPTKPFAAASRGGLLVVSWLDEATEPDIGARLDGPFRLGAHPVRLSLAGRRAVSYTHLLHQPPALKAAVEFVSPTYVSRSGRQLPLPDPELLLAGLARRWAAFSPLPLPGGEVEEVLGSVLLMRHDTATCTIGNGPHRRTGFTGRAVFGLPTRSTAAQRRVFAALWAFAVFAGVGAQTTQGLGQVRVDSAPLSGEQPRSGHRLPATAGKGSRREHVSATGRARGGA